MSSFSTLSKARVFATPFGAAFLDALAAGVWRMVEEDPLRLSEVEILLPSRRAARSAAEAFLRLGDGRPMLLPTLSTVSEVDEEALEISNSTAESGAEALDLPPAVSSVERQFLLTRLIIGQAQALSARGIKAPTEPDQAVRLAASLAQLLDLVQAERVDLTRLPDLVVRELAAHWEITVDFLRLLTEHWPSILESRGALDPIARRDALTAARVANWRENPPTHPVIVAGSTGSVPATQELMQAVFALPQGYLLLPGLDRELDEEDWSAVAGEPTHPNHGLLQLLKRLEIDRSVVGLWPGLERFSPDAARVGMIREMMRPAGTSARWRGLTSSDAGEGIVEGFQNVSRVEADTPREEAGAIAVLLREAVETPGKTAALVTPDRTLARRVSAELSRWGLIVDDSAGVPLQQSVAAVFLRLLTAAAQEKLAPIPLLALLKHPLCNSGRSASDYRGDVRLLDLLVLRGPRPASGFSGLHGAIDRLQAEKDKRDKAMSLSRFVAELEERLGPLVTLLNSNTPIDAKTFVTALVTAAEKLAEGDEKTGKDRLWAGEEGETLSSFLGEVSEFSSQLGAIDARAWSGLLTSLMSGRVVRPRRQSHPRIHILGTLEARLLSFDRLILGGLNEGSWPASIQNDPWLSRPMRKDIGLPEPERRIGLAAHDIAMAFGCKEVVLTRSARVDGAPTVPSRWWLRLETVAQALGRADLAGVDETPLAWFEQLDSSSVRVPALPPEPRPPLSARPTRLPVTQVEKWLTDPYSIYARYVMGLFKLEDVDSDPTSAERGSAIHKAFELFFEAGCDVTAPDARDRLIAFGRQSFHAHMDRPGVSTFWWPRFERVVDWFIGVQKDRLGTVARTVSEAKGEITLEVEGQRFELYGYADRIDFLNDGGAEIIDYKTGGNPTRKDLETGAAPQLPLEALILAKGGFEGLDPAETKRLSYWRVGGGNPPGKLDEVAEDVATLVSAAEQGLNDLIRTFADESTPYHAVPVASRAPKFNDYAHLARTDDWSRGEE